jgi:hypothetical protein
MSRSNNTEIINPAKFFYEWVGSKGCIKYFDKSKGEKGEQVFLQLPFTFLVLDRLSTIKGFSDADQSGFWSNEVRDLKKEVFNVRTKKGLVASGLYSTMAPILNQGASYCQSVYIAVKDEKGNFQICNFGFHGSAIGEWINLCKGKDIYKYAITIASAAPMTKGATKYFIPVFKVNPKIAESTEAKCIELDKELQEYMKAYFARNNANQQENISSAEVVTDKERQAINSLKHENSEVDAFNAMMAEDSGITEPIDDLPF